MEVACVVMVVRMLEASVQCCVVYIEALKGREWEMKHRDKKISFRKSVFGGGR